MISRRLSFIAISLFVANQSCASMLANRSDGLMGSPEQQSWEQDKALKRRRAPYKTRKLINKRQSLKSLAKGFSSPEACYRAAKSNSVSNLSTSWALLQACIVHGGFTSLEQVLEDPWIQIIRKQWPASAKGLNHLIALRGGNVELDLGLLTRRGLKLRPLGELVLDAEGEKNALVMFRGKVLNRYQRGGKSKLLITTEFGDIEASFIANTASKVSDQEQIFLAYFRGAKKEKDVAAINDLSFRVDLLSAYPIGMAGLH